ncbi:proline rich transmembrane protein 1B-like [Anneissia japonica]|uniref:proline rich transmembrane protein 1B-like n=1 Tax=Anneissia japonica TaxID=1529436 RepID=UPI001425B570|nr:proline rich transmembrane protein 1B-like [Anneissia japonica]
MEKAPISDAPANTYPVQAPPAYGQTTPYGAPHSAYNVQPVTSVTVVRTRPNNYLVMAILVTICCCVPFGIVGIVYSVDSSSKFDRGDDAGALSSATSAKNWSIAGLVCGVVFIIIIIILQVTVLSTTTTYSY